MPKFEAVVMGGSAGCLDVLMQLLPEISSRFPLPIIVVMHMLQNAPSETHLFLQRYSHLPIVEVEDKNPIKSSTVYFAPPGYYLLIEDNKTFSLSKDSYVCFSRPSIDVLFESAAEVYGERLIGVLLTGANTDGAHGVSEIKKSGGIVIVQDPKTAQASFMPEAALARTRVDYVIPLPHIAKKLMQLASNNIKQGVSS